ncbi:hypothetical protein M427DRAFT_50953 [Gonapodya prolifera JEL478]|uniref:Uncharacterized protein n=1 Tax=Gonapodya prolifera (strain JEL478) TaxID=1344416 RepID=A0A139AXQ0_GONPJ|nr:hypothetical protein M427DRAFT_50953 [Gonapodya prolifera JEL478]|eukprot:KXS21522.1 hypothetical protein M427DRAFT_50953 [Gonapodya prolifera JEL478]
MGLRSARSQPGIALPTVPPLSHWSQDPLRLVHTMYDPFLLRRGPHSELAFPRHGFRLVPTKRTAFCCTARPGFHRRGTPHWLRSLGKGVTRGIQGGRRRSAGLHQTHRTRQLVVGHTSSIRHSWART